MAAMRLIDALIIQGGGIPPNLLMLGGDSAGGNLALSLLYVIRQVRLERVRRDLLAGGQHTILPRSSPYYQNLMDDDVPVDDVSISERWMARERERSGPVIESVKRVLDCRQKQKERHEEGQKEEEACWKYINLSEEQRLASERQYLASDEDFMLKHQLPFEMDEQDRSIFPPMPLCGVLLSPWVDLRFDRRPFSLSLSLC